MPHLWKIQKMKGCAGPDGWSTLDLRRAYPYLDLLVEFYHTMEQSGVVPEAFLIGLLPGERFNLAAGED